MRLFLSIEAQNAVESGLADILQEVNSKLSFVTNSDANIENIDNYGTEFCLVSIIPTCVDDLFWNSLGWKERTQVWRKKKEADFRLRMDYDRFLNETTSKKRLMFIEVIIKSIEMVQERAIGDFKGDLLIYDIRKALELDDDSLS